MIVEKLADIVTCCSSYYIFFNLQCQRQHLFQPQVRTRLKFHPLTEKMLPRDAFTSVSSDGGGGDGGKGDDLWPKQVTTVRLVPRPAILGVCRKLK